MSFKTFGAPHQSCKMFSNAHELANIGVVVTVQGRDSTADKALDASFALAAP
jgi:hypothetical protein